MGYKKVLENTVHGKTLIWKGCLGFHPNTYFIVKLLCFLLFRKRLRSEIWCRELRGFSLWAAFKEVGYGKVLEKQSVQENFVLERVSRFSSKYLLYC